MKRLTVEDWDDVADLCEQGGSAADVFYENHTVAGKKKAAEWMWKLAMKAHDKARKLEEKVARSKKSM